MQRSAVLQEYCLGAPEIRGNPTSVIRGRTGAGKGSCRGYHRASPVFLMTAASLQLLVVELNYTVTGKRYGSTLHS